MPNACTAFAQQEALPGRTMTYIGSPSRVLVEGFGSEGCVNKDDVSHVLIAHIGQKGRVKEAGQEKLALCSLGICQLNVATSTGFSSPHSLERPVILITMAKNLDASVKNIMSDSTSSSLSASVHA